MLEQYPITDLIQWLNDKTLIPNPNFQRRPVWPPEAKTYFIDTILRDLPVPNIYFRTVVDLRTKRSYREVVDGQQRLRTIQEFVCGDLTLRSRAQEYKGKKYDDLDDEKKRAFLGYTIGVVQLFNAADDLVIDIFRRINAYGLPVNKQELRHAKYADNAFQIAVEQAAKRWEVLWEQYKVVSLRGRVRMADDELMAQMLGILLDGVVDGGQPNIDRLYEKHEQGFASDAIQKLDQVLSYIVANFSETIETPLSRAPQFLMFFAALAHALVGIPEGGMGDAMPQRDPQALADMVAAKSNLSKLAEVLDLEEDEVPQRFAAFKIASSGSTQRIRTRKIRFPTLYRALLPEPI